MNTLKYITLMIGLVSSMVAEGEGIYLLSDRQMKDNKTINLSEAFFVAKIDNKDDPISASFSKLEKKIEKKEMHRLPMTPNLFWVCVVDHSGGRSRVFSINLAKGLIVERSAETFSDEKVVLGKDEEKEKEAFLDEEFSKAVLTQYKKDRPLEWEQLVKRTLDSTGQKLESYLGL